MKRFIVLVMFFSCLFLIGNIECFAGEKIDRAVIFKSAAAFTGGQAEAYFREGADPVEKPVEISDFTKLAGPDEF